MPIDPRILLAGQQPLPQIQYDPVGQAQRLALVPQAVRQNRLAQLQLEEAERGVSEEEAVRGAYRQHAALLGTPEGEAAILQSLATQSPGAYRKERETQQKGALDRAKVAAAGLSGRAAYLRAQLDMFEGVRSQIAGLFSGVRDEASFQQAFQRAKSLYDALPNAAEFPLEQALGTTYDPTRVQQFLGQMRTAQERIADQRRLADEMQERGLMERYYGMRGLQERRLTADERQHQERLAKDYARIQADLGISEETLRGKREELGERRIERQTEPLRKANQKRLESIQERADLASNFDTILDQAEQLRSQGVYEASPQVWAALKVHKPGISTLGLDAATLDRTQALLDLGSRAIQSSVNLAAQGFTKADSAMMQAAFGAMTQLQPSSLLSERIANARAVNTRLRKQGDIAVRHMQDFGELPEFGKPAALIKQLMDRAKSQGMKLTPDQAREILRDEGYIE